MSPSVVVEILDLVLEPEVECDPALNSVTEARGDLDDEGDPEPED